MDAPRKKILFLVTKSTLGGAQQYVYDLAVHLDREKYLCSVAVGGNGPLIDALNSNGIKVYVLKNLERNISFVKEFFSLIELIKLVRKVRPDILHINSSKAGVLGSIVGRLCGVQKIIFTAHGWAFNEDRPRWQRVLYKSFHALTIFLSHKTITVSNGMKTQMNVPLTKRKMVTIHPGRTITDLRTQEDARGVLEMQSTNPDAGLIDYHTDFWLGTIAELHPIKRLNRAIDSLSVLVREFPNLRFIIIHDGELREILEKQVQNLGLQKHVFFMGTIENASRLLSAFDAFVLPSKSEAFGYVLIEAGLAKVPIVATDVGGVPDIIENGKNGILVPPDNTPALTEALRTLINNAELRERLVQAHFEKAQQFSLEKMARETEHTYLS